MTNIIDGLPKRIPATDRPYVVAGRLTRGLDIGEEGEEKLTMTDADQIGVEALAQAAGNKGKKTFSSEDEVAQDEGVVQKDAA